MSRAASPVPGPVRALLECSRTRFALSILLLFLAGLAATLFCTHLFFAPEEPVAALMVLPPALVVALVLLMLSMSPRTAARPSWVLLACSGLWFLVFSLGCANLAFGFAQLHSYGDKPLLLFIFNKGNVLPKWLVVCGLFNIVRAVACDFRPVASLLPASIEPLAVFIRVTGALSMGAATLYLALRHPRRLSVAFTIFTPMWLAFSLGYIECYPYIAWIVPVLYLWLLDKPIGERNPYEIGAIAGALPLIYIAFLPLSVIILGFFACCSPRKLWRALLTAAATALVLVRLFYNGPLDVFIGELSDNLNLGGQAVFSPYQGMAANEASLFFESGYALSLKHLGELAYMFWFGAGVMPLLTLIGGCAFALRARVVSKETLKSSRFWLAVSLLGWALAYFLFMLPGLGPYQDIDLFFLTYLSVAFFAGHLLDILFTNEEVKSRACLAVLAPFLGGTIVCTMYLVWEGLPSAQLIW
ncbi:MAG: hypothetical protein JXR94_18790 [Candidatus Hydrogenedentes bacterium]|nr:hypothetical protein [Candidatus Hydrogenedentota bacterium]